MKRPTARAAAAVLSFVLLSLSIIIFDRPSKSFSISHFLEASEVLEAPEDDYSMNSTEPSHANSVDQTEQSAVRHDDDRLKSVNGIIEASEARTNSDMLILRSKEVSGPSMDRFVETDNQEQVEYDNAVIANNEREITQDDSFVSNFWKPEWSLIFS